MQQLDAELLDTIATTQQHLIKKGTLRENAEAICNHLLTTAFQLNGAEIQRKVKIGKKKETIVNEKTKDPSMELLSWHNNFAHISMTRFQYMAKQGYLPKQLATCRNVSSMSLRKNESETMESKGVTTKQDKHQNGNCTRTNNFS